MHKICQFGQFIFEEIIKIAATRSHLLKLKCTKFDFGWGSAPHPAGGALSAPPDRLAGFWGFTFEGNEGEKEGSRRGKTKKGREG